MYIKIDNILHDGNKYDFTSETTLINRKSRKLYIKFSVPVKENKKENHCVGILIAQQRTKQLGLN